MKINRSGNGYHYIELIQDKCYLTQQPNCLGNSWCRTLSIADALEQKYITHREVEQHNRERGVKEPS